jgi:uncharacterized protein YdbL (DUF1318 family)
MKLFRAGAFLSALLFTAACVTINVYFPTAEAVEAADQIIRGVYGKDNAPPPPESPEPQSLRSEPLAIAVLNLLVSPAYAEADLSIDSPAVNALRASMKARFSRLEPYFESGAIGMTRDGRVAVRDLNAVPLPQRRTVNSLVADESRDRDNLYKEIAAANGHPEWQADIRATFAKRWVDNAPGGWWYQNAKGGWVQK